MGQLTHLHPINGKWKSITAKSYANEISIEFRDDETYYAIAIFPGDRSKLSVVNDLIAELLKLGGREIDESKERKAVP